MHGVDGEMITEKELQDITEKYSYYLECSYSDIALSKSGKVYFIEMDQYGECNSFYIAEKAEELERIIKMNIYENMECIIDVAIEDADYQFQRYEVDNREQLTKNDYEEKLRVLIEKLDMVYQSLRKVHCELLGRSSI